MVPFGPVVVGELGTFAAILMSDDVPGGVGLQFSALSQSVLTAPVQVATAAVGRRNTKAEPWLALSSSYPRRGQTSNS